MPNPTIQLPRLLNYPDYPMRAVVLLSGGLDSYTAAAIAKSAGLRAVRADDSVRPAAPREVEAARAVAACARRRAAPGARRSICGPIGGSSLTSDAPVPRDRDLGRARHSVDLRARAQHDLSVARARLGRSRSARTIIVIGVNALDYSGYPDCRPEFIAAFERWRISRPARVSKAAGFACTRRSSTLSKADIIRRGLALGARLRADPQLLRSRRRTGAPCGTL